MAFVTAILLPGSAGSESLGGAGCPFRECRTAFRCAGVGRDGGCRVNRLLLIIRLDLWGRFLSAAYWWMDTRVALWLLFTLMLFVAELLVLDR